MENIKLNMFGLPAIQDINDFSEITHISKYTIYQLSHNANKYYKTYTIPKKSGGVRTISQPNKNLKGFQSWILVNILNKLKASNNCKGFENGSSIKDNVVPHLGANTLLTIDLKDFFPTITRTQIYNIFKSIGYNNLISTILTNLCTYNGFLPQGSPCSPKLANLSTWRLDLRIQGYVGKRGINYTRYADDLSFSGLSPGKVVGIIPIVKKIIEDEKFEINPLKTRIASCARAKIITGLVISNEEFGIRRDKYKDLRAKIHKLAFEPSTTYTKLYYEVCGWLAYLNSVDEKRLDRINQYIKKLANKHPDSLVEKIKIIKSRYL